MQLVDYTDSDLKCLQLQCALMLKNNWNSSQKINYVAQRKLRVGQWLNNHFSKPICHKK